MNTPGSDIVGLIPAAGMGTRISPIPCSKEIFPVGFSNDLAKPAIKVAVTCLLDSFCNAGVEQVYMVTRKGKWDIPQYLGLGTHPSYSLAYLFTDPTEGTHHTLDLAYHFIKDRIVLLGFPDILFKPQHVFEKLLAKQIKTNADVVLGLFKATNPLQADMVDIDDEGSLRKIIIKPDQTDLTYTWTTAVWTPAFSDYLHRYISEGHKKLEQGREVYIGDVIQQALEEGLTIETVLFSDGRYIDIGTLGDLRKVWDSGF